MSVTGNCPNPNCDNESALFLVIDKNGNVAVECPPSKCNYQAACSFADALSLIDESEFPIPIGDR